MMLGKGEGGETQAPSIRGMRRFFPGGYILKVNKSAQETEGCVFTHRREEKYSIRYNVGGKIWLTKGIDEGGSN